MTYRRIDSQERNTVDALRYSHRQGIMCYIKRQSTTRVPLRDHQWPSAIECLSRKGELVFFYEPSATGIIKDILLKEDGSLVIAELINRDGSGAVNDDFFLQLSHYLFDHAFSATLKKRQVLVDKPEDNELYYYSFNHETGLIERTKDDALVDNDKPLLFHNALVKLVDYQDDIYVMAYTYGVKIYRLGDDLTPVWDVQVMPAYDFLWTRSLQNQADMHISDDGQIYLAFELYWPDALIYQAYFDRKIEIGKGQSGIAIDVFDINGGYQRSLLLNHHEHHEQLTSIIYHEGSLWLVGNVRQQKADATRGSTEWDMLLAQLSSQAGELLGYHLIHYDKEDIVNDCQVTPNGNFIFAGTTGFIQVDTNSQVSFGRGLIAEISQTGEILRSQTMANPRNVSLTSIISIDNDQALFAGVYDGPITHTGDKDNAMNYQKGVVGKIQWQE